MNPWPSSDQFVLTSAGIHVWSASLAISPETHGTYQLVLSDDELERAARFRFDIHRSRFTAARAILRTLAAGYLGLAPGDVEFCYGMNGKPEIAGAPFYFNASHSEDQGLFAFTQIAPLGVDLEHVRPVSEMVDIAGRFFSPREAAAILALPARERTVAFFRCWTRKEAFIKATGEGLSFALDRFAVSLDESAALLCVEPDTAEASEWSLFHLDPEEGYIGALAIRHRRDTLSIQRARCRIRADQHAVGLAHSSIDSE